VLRGCICWHAKNPLTEYSHYRKEHWFVKYIIPFDFGAVFWSLAFHASVTCQRSCTHFRAISCWEMWEAMEVDWSFRRTGSGRYFCPGWRAP